MDISRGQAIVLIGLSGSGKTSCGRLLAESLGITFLDADQEIEKSEGMTVADIFRLKGEAYFRLLESQYLEQLLQSVNGEILGEAESQEGNLSYFSCVLSTGGGMPVTPGNFEKLAKLGRVVYLQAAIDALLSRLADDASRPLLSSGKANAVETLPNQSGKVAADGFPSSPLALKLSNMLAVREPIYRKAPHCIDTTNLTATEVVDQILQFLEINK